MPWQQLQLRTSSADSAELEQLLLEAGAISVTLLDAEDQAVFQTEPGATPLWDSVLMTGLFELEMNLQPLTIALEKLLAAMPEPRFTLQRLEDQEWEKAWMADFHPMQFGKRLWICPHWLSPPDPEAVNIMLDPGLAFGTGTHATTALCLEWLEQADLEGNLVIDFGSGSGVLGIAAALLGAEHVIAVDNDPQAIVATESNRDSNNISREKLSCFLPPQFQARSSNIKADILIANILAEPLRQLAADMAQLTRAGGSLVLSGILPEQATSLTQHYQQWFDMENPEIRDGWVRLCGRRRYSS